MKKYIASIPAVIAVALAASPAIAGEKEDAWAACAWEKAPVSAANWIEMPTPDKYPVPGLIKPEYALKMRLDAACLKHLTEQGIKRPRAVSYKNVHRALRATRPTTLPGTEVDPLVFVCLRYFEDDQDLETPVAERWGYGADLSQSQFGASSAIFASSRGGGVSLDPNGGVERCKYVQSDGSLIDA